MVAIENTAMNRPFKKFTEQERSLGIIVNVGDLIGMQVNENKATTELLKHPDYPSFLTISDVLSIMDIVNEGVMLEKEDLQQIEFPAVCLIHSGGEQVSVIVTQLKENIVTYLDPQHGYMNEELIDFVIKWGGPALLVDKGASLRKHKGNDNTDRRFLPWYTVLSRMVPLLLFGICVVANIYHGINFWWICFSMAYCVGTYLSLSLFHEEIEDDSMQSFCSRKARGGCHAVLRSSLSYVLPFLKWSDLCFSYFATGLLSIGVFGILSLNHSLIFSSILISSGAGIFFSFRSLYLQLFRLKTWCKICNLVSLTNFIIFMVAAVYFSKWSSRGLFNDALLSGLVIFSIFILNLLTASVYRLWINASQELKVGIDKFNLLDRSEWFYDAFLSNCSMEENPFESNELLLGNTASENEACIVLSPFCGHCKTDFEKIIEVHHLYGFENIKIRIRMLLGLSKTYNGSIVRRLIQQRLVFLNESEQEKIDRITQLFQWNPKMNPELNPEYWLQEKQFQTITDDRKEAEINKLMEWADVNSINSVPTLILNNRIVPSQFYDTYLKLILYTYGK